VTFIVLTLPVIRAASARALFKRIAAGDYESARSIFSGALGGRRRVELRQGRGLPRALDPSPAPNAFTQRRDENQSVMDDDRAALQELVETADRVLRNLDECPDPRYPGITELREQIEAVRDEALSKLAPIAQSAALLLALCS
jgi:hypothetical protein